MNRRDFLRFAAATGALTWLDAPAWAAPLSRRVLVDITLPGGPDLRHLFPPAPDSSPASYAYQYWQARASSHGIAAGSQQAVVDRFATAYDAAATTAGTQFGILKQCGWLKSMWSAGKVAVLHNVLGATSRDHSHAQLVLDHGDRSTLPNQLGKAGWGGRLVAGLGGSARIVSVTRAPRPFCYGPHPTDRLDHRNDRLLNIKNSRALALTEAASQDNTQNKAMANSLRAYYEARAAALGQSDVFGRIVQSERGLRQFGSAMTGALAGIPVPAAVQALYTGQPPSRLNSGYFGEQIRNLYDTLQTRDILDMRVASLDYGGWDSHDGEIDMIEPRLADLFGTGRALDTLWQALDPQSRANMVFVIAGEFGRQLKSNGGAGTDHGRGMQVIVIGETVKGGFYGDPFPQAELARLSQNSPDVEGLTAIERVFGVLADWVAPGAGDVVFPGRGGMPLESGNPLGFMKA